MTATRSNRIAQVLLIVMGFFVGIVLSIIVSKALLNDTSVLTKQQRKLDVDRAPVEYVRVPGIGRVAYQFLFEELSEPGESLDGFALRIAPSAAALRQRLSTSTAPSGRSVYCAVTPSQRTRLLS